MSLLMSGIMSLAITTFNMGLVDDLLARWLEAWGLAFSIAFPVVLLVAPLAHCLVGLVVREE